jgi:hypothetical protein
VSGGNGVDCALPVLDKVGFNATSFRNAIQWNGRLDKVFKNDRHSNYVAMFADLRARFASGAFFDVSYTRSASKDNTQGNPTWQNQQAFYGPSNWDAPNRLSATASYNYKGVNHGEGLVGRVTGGWGVSSMMIAQSGYPFTIANYNSFHPTCGTASAPYSVACAPGVAWTGNDGGDYNADGNSNMDYPNVSSYAQTKGRKNWLTSNSGSGTVASSQWSGVAFGTAQEGSETVNRFRGPSFFEANASLMKDTTILHSVQMQFRLDVFNLFQNSNLDNIDTNINDGTNFTKALNALEPRWMQVGIGFKF